MYAALALTLTLSLLLTTGWWVDSQRIVVLPDFSSYTDVKKKKQAFFSYLQPLVTRANKRIERDREKLLRLQHTLTLQPGLTWHARVALNNIAERYHIDTDGATSDQTLLDSALRRANVVPAALVMVQAAKESGWGTSKFARLGNNLFGQQCFIAGCGFVPAARAANRRHEVARYRTPQQSVQAYLNNLNSHPRYQHFRDIRAELAAAGQPLRGKVLAEGLVAYSERGQVYIDEVKAMIAQNGLE